MRSATLRIEQMRRRLVALAIVLGVLLLGVAGFAATQALHARAEAAALRSLDARQRAQMQSMGAIRQQLQRVQTQNTEIQRLIGVQPARKMSYVAGSLHELSIGASKTTAESDLLRRMTMRLLNIRHLRGIARAQALAAIPSIDPVEGAAVDGCFCYRSYPDASFHPGVDLSANYGDPVRAAAAGTIAAAGWDGDFGLKIDIDHGNGYHTWYAHLSGIAVKPGEHVYKGEQIGRVGSTGYSTGPHLHYQLMFDGTPIDPAPYLDGIPPKVLASLP